MPRSLLFGCLGFAAGFITSIIGFMVGEGVGALAHPFPPNFDYTNHEAMTAYIRSYPDWVLGVAVGIWGLTLIAASWVGTRIGGRIAGVVLGAVLAMLFYSNVIQHPYPFWFKAAEFVSIPICLIIGHQMAMAVLNSQGKPSVKPQAV